jgi:hypothetical protein
MHASFESGISDEQLASELNPIKEKMLAFLKNQLLSHQPRDDYIELLQFLGHTSISVTIHTPGANHQARLIVT